MSATVFQRVERIADAVMYEGYVLYPYRASAVQNRFRWQFGVVAPRRYADDGGEPWYAQTECLVECGERPRLSVKVRCLQLQRRTVEQPRGDGGWRACDRVVVDGRELLTWDEAVPRAMVSAPLVLDALSTRQHTMRFDLASGLETETVLGADGRPAARITRERWPTSAVVRVESEAVGEVLKVRVRVENPTPWTAQTADARGRALRQSLLGCHTLLHVEDAHFVSLIDPPPHAAAASKSCMNEHTWPVLAGASGARDVMLSAPIILYDFPAIAPESRDCFFDGTEIDEMLALRVMTMAESEKREAAATDERAAAIVGRPGGAADAALHGAIRSFEQLLDTETSPEHDFVEVNAVRVSAGTRVRLVPRKRADSMDMFLTGRIARISAVYRDLENRAHLAVTIEGDPGADLREAYGRYFYFSPDEVWPLDGDGDVDAAR